MVARILARTEEGIAIALLVILFLVLLAQVLGRFVVQNPPIWSEELARYLFVWVVFIGASDAVRTRTHIAMNLAPDLMPVRIRALCGVAMDVLVAAALAVLVLHGWWGAVRSHNVLSITLGVPESLLYGAVPVGAALMSLRLLLRMVRDLRFVLTGRGAPGLGSRHLSEGKI